RRKYRCRSSSPVRITTLRVIPYFSPHSIPCARRANGPPIVTRRRLKQSAHPRPAAALRPPWRYAIDAAPPAETRHPPLPKSAFKSAAARVLSPTSLLLVLLGIVALGGGSARADAG